MSLVACRVELILSIPHAPKYHRPWEPLCSSMGKSSRVFHINSSLGDLDLLPAEFAGLKGTVVGDLVCTVQSVVMNSLGCLGSVGFTVGGIWGPQLSLWFRVWGLWGMRC